ncbi:MAG TPA: hypothetical protein VE993_14305 [Stellaceae bacterium]|nr:hypothetical protein [Stellaceae bacterium]
MDLKSVREEAIEATNRFFADKQGFVPAEDSEEWEEEYRRQFARAKARHAAAGAISGRTGPGAAAAQPLAAAPSLPELTGTPEQKRWAAAIRADRLGEIQDPQIRAWLARDWTRARAWIDTRELSPETFRARAAVWYADHCRQAAEKAKAASAERQSEAAAAAALQAEIAAAGITPAGLVELVDASERAEPAPIKKKLAEIAADGRTLRLYETANPAALLVKEKNREGQSEYGIERDEGLVADLKLYARAAAPS